MHHTKQYTKAGIEITHPSGFVSRMPLEQMRDLKVSLSASIARYQEQINLLNVDIKHVENAR